LEAEDRVYRVSNQADGDDTMHTPEALIESYQAEYDAALANVRASNADILERLSAQGANVYYDPEDDTLIATVGDQSAAVCLDFDDVLMIRHDPVTWKILGFEVPSVQAFLQAHPHATKWIRDLVQYGLQAPGTFVYLPPSAATGIAEQARELVLV
jgi:hypothetical protein